MPTLEQKMDRYGPLGFPVVILTLIVGLCLAVGCEPLGLWDSGPRIELSTQTVKGNSTVVNGDTVIFRRIRREENAPCHFFEKSCDLPPVPVEGGDGTIHLKKGYFLDPGGVPMRGDVSRDGNKIEIRIWADHKGLSAVPSITVPIIYEAWVRDLSPGTYNLRVVHERDALRVLQGNEKIGDDDHRAVVADTTVEVQ